MELLSGLWRIWWFITDAWVFYLNFILHFLLIIFDFLLILICTTSFTIIWKEEILLVFLVITISLNLRKMRLLILRIFLFLFFFTYNIVEWRQKWSTWPKIGIGIRQGIVFYFGSRLILTLTIILIVVFF